MAFKFTGSVEKPRTHCSSRPQPTPICPNACCLLHQIQADEMPIGALRPFSYPRRAILIEQGHPVLGVFVICHGWIKVAQRTLDGEIAGLDVCGPGELIGARELLADEPLFDLYAQTLCETQIIWVQRTSLLNLLHRRPDFALKVSQRVAQTAGAIQHRFVQMLYARLEGQIAYLLSYLHEKQAFVQIKKGGGFANDRAITLCHLKCKALRANGFP
jgi:CRP-like cAMP-binding protein